MDRDSLELLALTVYGISGFLLFVLLLLFYNLDEHSTDADLQHSYPDIQKSGRPKYGAAMDNPRNREGRSAQYFSAGCLSKSRKSAPRPAPFVELQIDFLNSAILMHEGESASIYKAACGRTLQGEILMGIVKKFHNARKCKVHVAPGRSDVYCQCYLVEKTIHSRLAGEEAYSELIVPLLGYCENDDEVDGIRFLLYEYEVMGNLSQALAASTAVSSLTDQDVSSRVQALGCMGSLASEKTCFYDVQAASLSWIVRFKIALGVAKALAFLHSCGITHRDVKGSSILLTKDYNTKLGSLARARLIANDARPMYDIYCFGRVLLDLITGLDISGGGDDVHLALMLRLIPLINCRTPLGCCHDPCHPDNYPADHSSGVRLFLKHFADRRMVLMEDVVEEVEDVTLIAMACLDLTRLHQLSMNTIVQWLENPESASRSIQCTCLYHDCAIC